MNLLKCDLRKMRKNSAFGETGGSFASSVRSPTRIKVVVDIHTRRERVREAAELWKMQRRRSEFLHVTIHQARLTAVVHVRRTVTAVLERRTNDHICTVYVSHEFILHKYRLRKISMGSQLSLLFSPFFSSSPFHPSSASSFILSSFVPISFSRHG